MWDLITLLKQDYNNARLVDYSIGAPSYSDGYIMPSYAVKPIQTKATIGLRTITITVDFQGSNSYEIETYISKFTAMLYDGMDIEFPDGFMYDCVYNSQTASTEKAPWIHQVEFNLSGYRHGQELTSSFSATGTLEVIGNRDPEPVITVNITTAGVTVCGVTISDITGTVIIDSRNKTVLKNGENVFGYTDITEFPKLTVGQNEISIKGKCTVDIAYCPLYY